MRRSRGDGVRVFVGAASVVLVGVLLLGACGRAGPPAEEQKTVPIGVMLAMTGGAGGPTQYSFTAMQDYVDYFNEEEMIPGVELQLAWIDTGTDELGRSVPISGSWLRRCL